MLFILLSVITAVVVAFFAVGANMSAPKHSGPPSDHFNGEKFVNPGNVEAKGPRDVLKWMMNRTRAPWAEDTASSYGKRPLARESQDLRITFVNHSTFLIQVDGLNILTDPIWSQRTSPFTWIGPKRMRVPGIKFEDLPKIDAVIISHNHYDHLDIPTLRTVAGSFHPKIFTPLGVKKYLDSETISGATDMDWWNEIRISDSVSIQSVPAQHFSGRGMLDRDATLWCGYVLKTSKGNIYFAGDTGYNEHMFKEIGSKSGDISVALLPIGAYKPAWFMSPIHTSPGEAVKAHFDLKAKVSIGMHFGTFPLADDGKQDPLDDLNAAMKTHSLTSEQFLVLREGEVYIKE